MRKLHAASLVLLMLSLVLAVCGVVSAEDDESILVSDSKTEIEVGLSYSHYSQNRLVVKGFSFYEVIIIGKLEVDEVTRDIFVPSVTIRHGLTPKSNIEVSIPGRYRVDDLLEMGNMDEEGFERTLLRGYGIGDIEAVLSVDTPIGKDKSFPLVTTVGIKAPTGKSPYDIADPNAELPSGSGHWGARIGLTTLEKFDPIGVFASLGYTANFSRTEEGRGTINPGDTFQASLGMAYAVHPNWSLNARFEQAYTTATKRDGLTQIGSDTNSGMLYLGANYAVESGFNFDFSLGIGLTEDSPDFTSNISIPIRF